MNAITMIGLNIILSAISAFSDGLLKKATLAQYPYNLWWMVAANGIYILTTPVWVYLMKYEKLAIVVVLYSLVTIILSIGVGNIFFGEKLSNSEWLGVGLALASMVLLVKFK